MQPKRFEWVKGTKVYLQDPILFRSVRVFIFVIIDAYLIYVLFGKIF